MLFIYKKLFFRIFAPERLFFLLFVVGFAPFLRSEDAKQSGLTNGCQILTIEGTVNVFLSGKWQIARPGQCLQVGDQLHTASGSRATVRFSDLSVLRVNELTTFGILPPVQENKKPLLDLKSGSLYFFSREKPAEIQFRTPTAAGAIRGTEFNLETSSESSTLTLIDGEVELANEAGRIDLKGGELGAVIRGQAPTKTPFIDAVNIIQWCLYYPAGVDVDEIAFSDPEKQKLGESLDAYRSGDLLKALELFHGSGLPASEAVAIYEAALDISVGQVNQADKIIEHIAPGQKLGLAMREMIAAVQNRPWNPPVPPSSASEWLAHSYYLQSKGKPEEALTAAYSSVAVSPSFGFAWVRIAELELGLGEMSKSRQALKKGVQLSPRNAQALTVQGFLLAAQDCTTEAQVYFDRAIAIDGALGNAWLGRGLCRIRRGESEEGRKDLQVAATLEPQRALLRSYLAKAFDNVGMDKLAEKDLRLAKKLDPNDPTAWLYSALINDRLNRINEAVQDLEKSKELNNNQQLFRSKLLLDQDQAVREANLALTYSDAGMADVGLREATKAVSSDYANYSAHLFLADSYQNLQDPKGYNHRYDVPATSEWLIANLLAPAGWEALSRSVAAREFSSFFTTDGFGFGSSTEYDSRGMWTESASQYGSCGKMAYALDAYYLTDPGQRYNNDLEFQEYSVQTKAQITDLDSFFLYTSYVKRDAGDVVQYYDPNMASHGFRVSETQDPNLFLGYHREWQPGLHTLALFGRVSDDLDFNNPATNPLFLYYRNGVIRTVNRRVFPFDQVFEKNSEVYSGELQQIWETGSQTLVLGQRVQGGDGSAQSFLSAPIDNHIDQDFSFGLQRYNVYGYEQWQVIEPVQLTLGLAYDHLEFPVNTDIAPISDQSAVKDLVEPKLGVVYTPWKGGTLRAHYTRSLGGSDAENGIRLEPTIVGGLNQSFRSLFPEPVVGSVPGSEFQSWACALDQTFQSGTYLSVEGQLLKADADRVVGALTNFYFFPIADSPSSARQTLDYEERVLFLSANQLLGREWSIGINERISQVEFTGRFPEVPINAFNVNSINQNQTALLSQMSLSVNYNHPSGFFMQYQSLWTTQNNEEDISELVGDNFWQHNIFLGYRFLRRHAEARVGILNLTDQDYNLYPLNFYSELPRTRSFVASFKFYF